jgi:predicted secreted protein
MAIAGRLCSISVSTAASSGFVDWDGAKSFSLDEGNEITERTAHSPQDRLRLYRVSYHELSLGVEGDVVPTDDGFTLVRSCFLNDSALWVRILLDGGDGLVGRFIVTSFGQDASVDGLVEFSVSFSHNSREPPIYLPAV